MRPLIVNLGLENFKAFRELTSINFAPITVLAGPNSGGKSTFIQSLLMLKQTFESQNPNAVLLLNSRLTHLGSFENVVYGKNPDSQISVKLTFEVPSGTQLTTIFRERLNFGLTATEKRNKARFKPRYLCDLSITLSGTSERLQSHRIEVESYEFRTYSEVTTPGGLLERREGLEYSFQRKRGATYQVIWRNAEPTASLGEKYGSSESKVTFVNLFPEAVEQEIRASAALYPMRFIIKSFFDAISYIGPLREEPARRYFFDDDVIEIGIKGENAPYILAAEGDDPVNDFYFPGTEPGSWEPHGRLKLIDALKLWMKHMGISRGISPEQGKDAIYLFLDSTMNSETSVTIADVGFGVSQILPILVEGLRTPRGSTVILEQPEIHLHPRLQAHLADFFISMALSGKRVLIETHSDHFMNRLVRRMVEGQGDSVRNLINAYFIEHSGEPGQGSVVSNVEIDEYRGIINWPKGFFDQTAIEHQAIIEAGIRKRKLKSSSNHLGRE